MHSTCTDLFQNYHYAIQVTQEQREERIAKSMKAEKAQLRGKHFTLHVAGHYSVFQNTQLLK